MIAKQGWFGRRKYMGWGAFPKTWQGWLYISVLILPFILMSLLNASAQTQLIISIVWGAIVVIAMIDIMASLRTDEREKIHEAIAERNALWIMLLILAVGVAYQTAAGIVKDAIEIDPVIIAALVGGLLVKAISNIYLDKKD